MISYLNFKIYDVFGNATLSAYTLPNTPLTFTPQFETYNLDIYSNEYLLWDFGDGSYSKQITATHHYTEPGSYNVKLKVIDGNGEGALDLINRDVTIYDFVSDVISLSTTGFTQLTAGQYSPPINVYRYTSWRTHNNTKGEYTIVPYASGSKSLRYDVFNYSTQPYSHLIPTHRFVIREQVGILNIYDDIIINDITTSNDYIYVKLNYDTQTYDIYPYYVNGSVFAGTSGTQTVFFVDDYPTLTNSGYNLIFTPNTKNFEPSIIQSNLPVLNTDSLVYSFDYIANSLPVILDITSNGIGGEGQDLTTFDINSSQFKEGVVSFVVRLKTSNNYTVNYIPLSGASVQWYPSIYLNSYINQIFVILLNKNDDIIPGFSSALSAIQFEQPVYNDVLIPYIKGKIYLSSIPATSSEGVKIFATVGVSNIDITNTDQQHNFYGKTLTGVSTSFNVYSKNNYGKVAKINENFDSYQAYQSLATQPVIAESNNLLQNVLGQIGGDINANFNTLGKRIYEKIANYVPNISDIDTCNIEALLSQSQFYGIDSINDNLTAQYPADLTRLIDLFSIKRNYLFGTRNNWKENLDKRTNVFSTINGINTNLLTTTYQTQVSALSIEFTVLNKNDQYIVAYENFTKLYSLQSLHIDSVSQTFNLSAIDQSWGWDLILPDNFYTLLQSDKVKALNQLYTFYKWNNYIDGTIVGNTINWGDSINTQITLPYYETYPQWNNPSLLSSWGDTQLSAWYTDNGYVDRNIMYTISNGLGILSG